MMSFIIIVRRLRLRLGRICTIVFHLRCPLYPITRGCSGSGVYSGNAERKVRIHKGVIYTWGNFEKAKDLEETRILHKDGSEEVKIAVTPQCPLGTVS